MFSVLLESGATAPNFIRFDPITMTFSIYSMAAGVAGTYYLLLVGQTTFYNQLLSTNIQRFKLEVKCFTTVIRPKNPIINFEIQIGSGFID